MTWDGDTATGIDLYYDPVVDEHVGRGPMGLIAPGWYLAPQRREVAAAGWRLGAMLAGALGDGDIVGLDNPALGVMLVQMAGEFADPAVKGRIWDAAEVHFEPTWDREAGEFTLGFGLDEEHPRGQWNARAMAGWVCTAGAWGRVFNEPDLAKFDGPEVLGVDFPRVAMSEARWDGQTLHLAAEPQNASARGSWTRMQVRSLPVVDRAWVLEAPDGGERSLDPTAGTVTIELVVDGGTYRLAASP